MTTSSHSEEPRLFGPVVRRVTRTLRYDKITRSIRVRGTALLRTTHFLTSLLLKVYIPNLFVA